KPGPKVTPGPRRSTRTSGPSGDGRATTTVAAGLGSMALDSRLPSADVTDEPSVRDRIRDAIDDHGPISFAEFMELALYSPGGFYDRPPVGEGGHFVTSPHVDPAFAACLAAAIRKAWDTLDRPDPFTLVEV